MSAAEYDRFVAAPAEAFRRALRSRRARTVNSTTKNTPSTDATETRMMRFAAIGLPKTSRHRYQ